MREGEREGGRRRKTLARQSESKSGAGGRAGAPGTPTRIPSRLSEPGSLFSRYKFLQLRLVVVTLLTRTRRELLSASTKRHALAPSPSYLSLALPRSRFYSFLARPLFSRRVQPRAVDRLFFRRRGPYADFRNERAAAARATSCKRRLGNRLIHEVAALHCALRATFYVEYSFFIFINPSVFLFRLLGCSVLLGFSPGEKCFLKCIEMPFQRRISFSIKISTF